MFPFTKTSSDESGDSSAFSHLPDEIILQILSKLIDLKTLCVCKLISSRFNQIVNQVDTISYNALPPSNPVTFYPSDSFYSVIKSLHRFTRLKSLRVEIPSSLKDVDDRCLFKWKMSFVTSSLVDSCVFLSPNSIFDTKGAYANGNVHDDEEQEDMVLSTKKWHIGLNCIHDAYLRRSMLMNYIYHFPLLEDVSVSDTNKRGRISVSGSRKIAELRNWQHSLTPENTLNMIGRTRGSSGYIPLLELPVSGYVLKGVFILLMEKDDLPDFDSFLHMNLKDSHDKMESAYNEAITEIFKKHRGNFKRLE